MRDKAKDVMKKGSFRKPLAAMLLSMLACILLLTSVCLIPSGMLDRHSKESADYFISRPEFEPLLNGWVNSIQDNFADTELLGIAYGIDNHKPFTSAVRAAYVQGDEESVTHGYYRQVNEQVKPNKLYSRYWHGSLVYIRPLLIFLNVQGIRIAAGLAIAVMQLITLLRMWQMEKRHWTVCWLLAFIAVQPWMLFLDLEYASVFLVVSAASLLMLRLIRKGCEGEAAVLFAGTGVVTFFIDFLTVETLTFTMPMLLLILHLSESGALEGVLDGLKRIVKNGLWWLGGYAGSFGVKLLTVLTVCGRSELAEAFRAGAERVGGQVYMGNTNLSPEATALERLSGAIWHNLSPLFYTDTNGMTRVSAVLPALVISIAAFILIFLFQRGLRAETLVPVMLLAVLPYLRYLVLSNHAFMHFFFTYRAQMVTITILFYLTWYYGLRLIPETLREKDESTDKSAKKNSAKTNKKRSKKR